MNDSSRQVLSARELMADQMFAGVPPKFLLWQQGLAVRWQLKAGEYLCRQGQAGNTAFLIRSGRLKVTGWAPATGGGGLVRLLGRSARPKPAFEVEVTPAAVIVGEMACLAGTPRLADISAAEDTEVWEIRRNLLDRMMRSPAQRATFEKLYRDRALGEALRQSEIFRDHPGDPFPPEEYKACLEFLNGDRRSGQPRLNFIRVNPGQTVFEHGDLAEDFYLVRLGHLRVSVYRQGIANSVIWSGPGSVIGEIGLLSLSAEDVTRNVDELDDSLVKAISSASGEALSAAVPAGRRTATCSALDNLELARIRRSDFLEMIKRFPTARRRLIKSSLRRLQNDIKADVDNPLLSQYVDRGLFQAQNLLAIDQTRCTHCDECTKACVQQHGNETHGIPVTRLLRDGVRLGQFLVATSCRSCKDAYCMTGCPVDSIHRGKHQQIVIEDHCIGCGLCASNCPFGNIWMVPNEHRRLEMPDPEDPGKSVMVAQAKAATCDLCDAAGELEEPKPRCVYACPHDAAHRMTGSELLESVQESRPRF